MDASFPNEVPKLKAENMCHGFYDFGDRHCLRGWAHIYERYSKTGAAPLHTAIAAQLGTWEIAGWNDSHTLEECADAWNKTALALGYIDAGDKFVRPA